MATDNMAKRTWNPGGLSTNIRRLFMFIVLVNLFSVSFCNGHNWRKVSNHQRGINRVVSVDPSTKRKVGDQVESKPSYRTKHGDIHEQKRANPAEIGGILIEQASSKLSDRLRWLSNNEIGVTKMQGIYDSLPYEDTVYNDRERLEEISERLRVRFKKYLQVLRTNKITVQNLYKFHVKDPITLGYKCCSMACSDFKPHPLYGCGIAKHTSCDLIPPSMPRRAFNPGRNLTEVWRSNLQYFPSLKWQYFISVNGLHNEYPANSFRSDCGQAGHSRTKWKSSTASTTTRRGNIRRLAGESTRGHDCSNVHDTRHRDVFLGTIQPQRKNVMIVMDHGIAMSDTQIKIAKAITKHLINSFSYNDMIGVFGLSNKPIYPRSDSCLPNTMVPATFETRIFFSNFIDNLDKMNFPTNHSLGFVTAFQVIEQFMKSQTNSDNAMILYVSRGLLTSLTEGREVMNTISYHNSKTGHKVIINTYAVIDDDKTIMLEKSFLKDVAFQNFAKYDVEYRLKMPVIRGIMMAINSTHDLSSNVGQFYLPLNRSAIEEPVFSLPYIDEADGGLTVSVSQPCIHTLPDKPDLHYLIGLVGVDLHMEDVAQDVTYYSQTDHSYAFIITKQGFTIMHPSFQRPLLTNYQPMHTDIRHFEQQSGFLDIRSKILSQPEGESSLLLRLYNTSSGVEGEMEEMEHNAVFIWKWIDSTPFIVVLKSFHEKPEGKKPKNILMQNQPDLLYHRIDLFPHDKMCYHLKQLSTAEMSTVFLSANSFVNPFEHLSEQETKRSVQSYIAYLKDNTRLITNPGLKNQVRNDVAATGRISENWLNIVQGSELNDYIVRRYVGTPNGVLRTYPGTLLDKRFDPTKRSWYNRALEFPGQVTLSAPYLDVGGAGYIVTISHTIYEGKPAGLHSSEDKVVAVMGIDLTLGYFHKLLTASIPTCEHSTIRCFLMDDRGYLIAHPGLVDPTGKGPSEQRHITHMEPLVANNILSHIGFVQKKLCNRYNDRTVQRYFAFNTSFTGTLTNLVHGEQCAKFQITHIAGSNMFLGLVNHSCDTATAFCPCSMYDRLCLNCHRMEQIECECPCECPLETDFCSGQLLDLNDKNPSCPKDPEEEMLAVPEISIKRELGQCMQYECKDKTSQMDCMGVIDCQWCQLHRSGKNFLEKPFCASQRVCFGGVMGARSPYGDEIKPETKALDGIDVKSTTPVGPVAGAIMGCFLMLALGVYCYRHRMHRHHHHHYVSTIPDNTHNHISQYYNDDEHEASDDVSGGECHTNFVLAGLENPASISPYRVNTSYRRPAGGDSDHGYSTMTPHEDSEHASMPCIDPLTIGGKDRFRPSTTAHLLSLSTISCNSSVSNPGKTPTLPPPPHNVSRRSRSPTPPQTRLSITPYTAIPEQSVLSYQSDTNDSAVSGFTNTSSTIYKGSSFLGNKQVPSVASTPTPISSPITNITDYPKNVLANVQVHMVDSH